MSEWRQYRAQARSFERQAELARRDDAREEFLTLARQWDQLADEAERAERRDWPPARERGESQSFGLAPPNALVIRR
jgi:hypothetical protein